MQEAAEQARLPCFLFADLLPDARTGRLHGGPDYRKPQVEVMNQYRFEDETSRDIADSMWWEQFKDPVMNELIRVALDENKDIRIAAARIEEFQGRFGATRSELFPQLGGNARGERLRSSAFSWDRDRTGKRCATRRRR